MKYPQIFIVGCPRSGTTLLQVLLASHSKIQSFKELQLFGRILSSNRILNRLGLTSYYKNSGIDSILEQLNLHIDYSNTFSLGKRIIQISRLLSEITENNGKQIWLEKTPANLYYTKYIEKYLPNSVIIHLIRSGKDTIASFFKLVYGKDAVWSNNNRSRQEYIDSVIKRWIKDIGRTEKCVGKEKHLIVSYKSLVNNTLQTLKTICNALDIDYENAMLDNYRTEAIRLVKKDEKWKHNVFDDIKNRSNFDAIFNEKEKERILKILKDNKLNDLSYLNPI